MNSRTGTTRRNGTAGKVKAELGALGSPEKAAHLSRFFKTGPGEYGEGDKFIGVQVPEQRRIAKRFGNLPLDEIDRLMASPIHEHRLTGLLILVEQFAKSQEASFQRQIVEFYLSRLERVNNWDLVDLSAPKLLGEHLVRHPEERAMLSTMAESTNLWERRVAVLATFPMIKQGQFDEVLALAEALLADTHDLMHKAVGWMLREAGKVDLAVLEEFLNRHAKTMPRTMLRYAVERLEPARRRYFMGR
ncbi:MAG: DNA alkylation repair protein [Rhodospirillales bacterium]|jgi:3-methyladenine DNA glycosylase AlkD|nr:DNA alkylation repair protein [Rhodospirillales bacterium]MDP6804168.1 DNA alkylation repair protein [Rhodospirillales bacterium]